MPIHPAFAPGRAAVITGGASGIGLAAARKCVALGMNVLIADNEEENLRKAQQALRSPRNDAIVRASLVDVGDFESVRALKIEAYEAFDDVAFLMNNAGVGSHGGGAALGDPVAWRRVVDTNLWGVVNGIQAFGAAMAAQDKPAVIVNTGSKQGITCPPGDAAYNVSKAGIKVATEALAHELRNREGCKVSAHLLIPGFTFTGISSGAGGLKPAGAWSADQVVDFMHDGLAAGDFYILCPDNEVTRGVDEKRMLWSADDIVKNRPALSRWHPSYKDEFAAWMAGARWAIEPNRR